MPVTPVDENEIRKEALARLASSTAFGQSTGNSLDQARLVHELQVSQIEMEMQGESLRQAHVALAESHDRYQELYELSPVGYLTLTRAGRISEINPTAAQLFDLDHASLIERNFADLLAPAESGHWGSFFKTLITQGGHENGEFRLARNAATALHVRLDCLAVRREQQGFAIHMAMTDISERKLAETRLSEQNEFFRLIIERLDGYVAVLDVDGRRIYNSPSYQQLLGKRNSSGTNSFDEIHPADRELVKQTFRETVNSGTGQRLEYRFLMPDDSVRTMESRGGVVRDSEGQTKYVVVVSNDVTERQAAEEKIRHMAFYDALTQLPNRQTLNDRLQQAMAASKRSGQYGALMFLDLDCFKPLNDAHGHGMGDKLLIQVAQRISDCVREIDTVARFGGDEFVVVLGELDVDQAKSIADSALIAEKIRAAIGEPYPLQGVTADGDPLSLTHRCTASIGIVLFLNHDKDETEILKLADHAMYRAKEEGRNRIHFDAPVP